MWGGVWKKGGYVKTVSLFPLSTHSHLCPLLPQWGRRGQRESHSLSPINGLPNAGAAFQSDASTGATASPPPSSGGGGGALCAAKWLGLAK